jgi:hypothetical protein
MLLVALVWFGLFGLDNENESEWNGALSPLSSSHVP